MTQIISFFTSWEFLLAFAIVGSYFFKYYLTDLITRFFQIFIRPLEVVREALAKSEYATIGLNFGSLLLNVIIVAFAVIMVLSEYSTLKEILKLLYSYSVENVGTESTVNFFGYPLEASMLGASTYIAIATILGLLGFELVQLKRVLAGILFKDYKSKHTPDTPFWKYIVGGISIVLMLCLSYYQGNMSSIRFKATSGEQKLIISTDSVKYVEKTTFGKMNEADLQDAFQTFSNFHGVLGFLTPVIAAVGLLSIDIYIAVVFNLFIFIIDLLHIFLVSVQYFVEALINFLASLIVKTFEIFGKFTKENANKNTNPNSILVNLAPLSNKNQVYLRNETEKYQTFFRAKKFIINSIDPPFSESLPSQSRPEFKLTTDSKIEDLAQVIWQYHEETLKHYFGEGSDHSVLEFYYFDLEGKQLKAEQSNFLYEFPAITNTFYLTKQEVVEGDALPVTNIVLDRMFSLYHKIANNFSENNNQPSPNQDNDSKIDSKQ